MKLCKALVILLSVIVLTSCSPVKMPIVAKYTITNYQKSLRQGASSTKLSLLITTPVAEPGYESSKMIYLKTPYRLQAYSRNQWVAPPAYMLLPIFEHAMRNARYFHAIVTPPFGGITDYRFDTKILALQQEFITPKSRVRLIVKATLLNNSTNRIVATRTFKVIVPVRGSAPYDGVLATSRAANTVAKKIARFVVSSI